MKLIIMREYELKDGEEWLVTNETLKTMLFLIGIILLGSFFGSFIMLSLWGIPIWESIEWVILCSLYLFNCTVLIRYVVRIVID